MKAMILKINSCWDCQHSHYMESKNHSWLCGWKCLKTKSEILDICHSINSDCPLEDYKE